MNRIVFFLIFIGISFFSFSQTISNTIIYYDNLENIFLNPNDGKLYTKGQLVSGRVGSPENFVSYKNGIIEGLQHYEKNGKITAEYKVINGKITGNVLSEGWKFEVKENEIINFPTFEDEYSLQKYFLGERDGYINTLIRIISYKPNSSYSGDSTITIIPFLKGQKLFNFDGGKGSRIRFTLINDEGFTRRKSKGHWLQEEMFKKIFDAPLTYGLLFSVRRTIDVNGKLTTLDSVAYDNTQAIWAHKNWIKNLNYKNQLDAGVLTRISKMFSKHFEYKIFEGYNGKLELFEESNEITGGKFVTYFYPNQHIKERYFIKSSSARPEECPYESFIMDKNGKILPNKTCILDSKRNVYVLKSYFPDGYEMASKIIPITSELPARIFPSFPDFFEKKINKNEDIVYLPIDIDQPAEYPGGSSEFNKFLVNNLNIPLQVKNSDLTNKTVYVNFIVNINGLVEEVAILKSLGFGCDEEAMRIVKSIKWVPGKKDGKNVRSKLTKSIVFN
jgi:hypothetical protein